MNTLASIQQSKSAAFFRRLGLAGFAFFLAKGLLWLVVPLVAGMLL